MNNYDTLEGKEQNYLFELSKMSALLCLHEQNKGKDEPLLSDFNQPESTAYVQIPILLCDLKHIIFLCLSLLCEVQTIFLTFVNKM